MTNEEKLEKLLSVISFDEKTGDIIFDCIIRPKDIIIDHDHDAKEQLQYLITSNVMLENENLKFENQRLHIEAHRHRGE